MLNAIFYNIFDENALTLFYKSKKIIYIYIYIYKRCTSTLNNNTLSSPILTYYLLQGRKIEAAALC